jgi:hypothetical protein
MVGLGAVMAILSAEGDAVLQQESGHYFDK